MNKGYIYSEQVALFGHKEIIGYGNENFYVKEIDRKLANEIIMKHHYSKKFYNASYIHLGVYIDNILKGVLQYGYAMNPASCSSVVKGTLIKEYLELNRMWIEDNVGKYPESQSISYSIKYIKGKIKTIKQIQSFADERCGGFGIVYQAASFSFYGEHTSEFWEAEDGEVFHNSMITDSRMKGQPAYEKAVKAKSEGKLKKLKLRQFRYIKFIDKREKKNCLLKEYPYPKHYEENKIK